MQAYSIGPVVAVGHARYSDAGHPPRRQALIFWHAKPMHRILTALILVMLTAGPGLSRTIVLKTSLQDSPPKGIHEGNQVSGICHDIFAALNQRLKGEGIRIEYLDRDLAFLPWKRSQQFLETGRLDLVAGMARTPERERKYQFSRVPLYTVRSILATRTGSPGIEGGLAGLAGRYVIAVRGTRTARLLARVPGVHVTLADSPFMALRMLLAKRGDVVFYHDLGLVYLLKIHHWRDRIRLGPVIDEYDQFMAYSRMLTPEIRKTIDNRLERMKKDGTMAKIMARYR